MKKIKEENDKQAQIEELNFYNKLEEINIIRKQKEEEELIRYKKQFEHSQKERELALKNEEIKKHELILEMEKSEQLHKNEMEELDNKHDQKINIINNKMIEDEIKYNNKLQQIKTEHINNMNLLELNFQKKKDEINNYYNMNPPAPVHIDYQDDFMEIFNLM